LIEEAIKVAEVVKVEMDAKTDPEMATALLVAKEEARVKRSRKHLKRLRKKQPNWLPRSHLSMILLSQLRPLPSSCQLIKLPRLLSACRKIWSTLKKPSGDSKRRRLRLQFKPRKLNSRLKKLK